MYIINPIVDTILYLLVVLGFASFLHEIAHVLYFQEKLKRDVSLSFRRDYWLYKDLSRYHKIRIYSYGIGAGLLFIYVLGVFDYWAYFMLIPYLTGCRDDIVKLKEAWRSSA